MDDSQIARSPGRAKVSAAMLTGVLRFVRCVRDGTPEESLLMTEVLAVRELSFEPHPTDMGRACRAIWIAEER